MSKDKEIEDSKENIAKKKSVRDDLTKHFKDILKGFENQNARAVNIADYWDIYNCQLGDKQFYNGNSQIFIPIVKNAVDARVTRFTNQLFPKSGRYVDITTNSGDVPYAHMALLEHYVKKSHLRTKIAPALIRQGDVEGQYTVNVTWKKHKRFMKKKVQKKPTVDGMEAGDFEDYTDIEEVEIEEGYPCVEIIHDTDFLILPQTADGVDDALDNKGGSVTIAMRLSKAEVQEYIDEGLFDSKEGGVLLESFGGSGDNQIRKNTRKDIADAMGIKVDGGKKYAMVYQTWKKINIDGEKKLCVIYYGGEKQVLGAFRNPYWCDKCPIISEPQEKIAGQAKGISPIDAVATMQYGANDILNEGMDSATYSLLPIIFTDPEKNPRISSMILSMAAIWETSPADTKFAEFPPLWKDAVELVASYKNEIFQTLSVNPAMMPNSSGAKKKPSQAEIANEQQIDLLTTADVVTMLEQGIFTPIIERFFEYDAQFRDEEVTVRSFGELGIRAKMEKIEPIQYDERYEFKWFGVDSARNIQNIQQQVSMLNVLRGIPPQMYPGRKLDLTPMIEEAVQNTFGPRLAPRIFKDMRDELSIEPEFENEIMDNGMDVVVHPMDDDIKHIKAHMQDVKEKGDSTGFKRAHMLKHQAQIGAKQQQQMQKENPKGAPGTPGGGAPGIAGVPKPGSVPQPPAGARQPNGAIHPDQMKDPSVMPRKM